MGVEVVFSRKPSVFAFSQGYQVERHIIRRIIFGCGVKGFPENTPSKRHRNLRIVREMFSKNTHQNGPEIFVLWEGNLYSEKHSSKRPQNLRIAEGPGVHFCLSCGLLIEAPFRRYLGKAL